jgi:hypothetical protein
VALVIGSDCVGSSRAGVRDFRPFVPVSSCGAAAGVGVGAEAEAEAAMSIETARLVVRDGARLPCAESELALALGAAAPAGASSASFSRGASGASTAGAGEGAMVWFMAWKAGLMGTESSGSPISSRISRRSDDGL